MRYIYFIILTLVQHIIVIISKHKYIIYIIHYTANKVNTNKKIKKYKNFSLKVLTNKKLYAIICKLSGISCSFAGVAQLAEQLICNQQVAGSSPITSSNMGEFPSGQRGQTVNLLLFSFDGPNPSSPTK